MISFACRVIEMSDLIKCSFDLNKTDYMVFVFPIKNTGELSIEELSKKLGLERSGYRFRYSIKDKERILSIIDGWHRTER
jgi:hypothetical protein